jgi:hypothetical protein
VNGTQDVTWTSLLLDLLLLPTVIQRAWNQRKHHQNRVSSAQSFWTHAASEKGRALLYEQWTQTPPEFDSALVCEEIAIVQSLPSKHTLQRKAALENLLDFSACPAIGALHFYNKCLDHFFFYKTNHASGTYPLISQEGVPIPMDRHSHRAATEFFISHALPGISYQWAQAYAHANASLQETLEPLMTELFQRSLFLREIISVQDLRRCHPDFLVAAASALKALRTNEFSDIIYTPFIALIEQTILLGDSPPNKASDPSTKPSRSVRL